MTKHEFVALMMPFALALRAEFDQFQQAAFYKVLAKVPAALLEQAINSYLDEGVRFLPGAPELKQRCEVVRRSLLANMPYTGCAECEHSKGWREVRGDGMAYMERCRCFAVHQDKVARAGLGQAVALLPVAEQPDGDGPVVYEQAPPGIQAAISVIAGRKVLR